MADPALPADLLGRLVEAAASVAGQSDLAAVLRTTVEVARDLTGARYGALGVIGQHGVLVEFVHAGMDESTATAIGTPPQGRGLLGIVTHAPGPVRIDHLPGHPDAAGFPSGHPEMDSFLGVPVRSGSEDFGNLYLTEKLGGFDHADETIVAALAIIAGSAISTARLQERLRRLAVVEDRERIARDLHDAVIQDLFAVGLSLQLLGGRTADAEIRTNLTDAAERLDEVIAALRRFIFDLHPPLWARRSLRLELPELIGNLAEPHSAEVKLSVTGVVEDLPDALVEDVVQVVREALSNALRHSGADVVTVSVDCGTDWLVITVADRGKGFEPDVTNRGMGLQNLRTRADLAGGQATIFSREGLGTTVRVVIPI